MRPQLELDLSGPDGNIFAVMGKAAALLRRHGRQAEAKRMIDEVTRSRSYEEALQVVNRYVALKDTSR